MSKSTAVHGKALSLGQRFARLQDLPGNYTPEEVKQMLLKEAGALVITFGKQMKGTSYAETVNTNPSWVKWFCDHYSESEKPEHQCFLIYATFRRPNRSRTTWLGAPERSPRPKPRGGHRPFRVSAKRLPRRIPGTWWPKFRHIYRTKSSICRAGCVAWKIF